MASVLACVARAAADDVRLKLHWVRGVGAEGCVTEDVLQTELRTLLANNTELQRSILVEGLIEADAAHGGFRAYFHVLDSSGHMLGTREILSGEPDCARATDSLLLVLSVLADLATRGSTEPPAPQPAPVIDHELPRVAPARPPAPAWELQPSAATGIVVGLSPGASAGVILGLTVRTPWALDGLVRAAYWPAGQTDVQRASGGLSTIDFEMFQVEAGLCLPVAEPGAFRFGVCWGTTLLVRYVRLSNISFHEASLRSTFGITAALELAYLISKHWSIQLQSELIGLSRRDRYVYSDEVGDTHLIYRANGLGAAFTLALGASL